MSLSKIENVKIQLCYMRESSGNEQIFLRAVRTDMDGIKGMDRLSGVLEYECRQTKFLKNLEECIDQAIFSCEFLLRFFGLTVDDITFAGFTPEMIKITNKSIEKWIK